MSRAGLTSVTENSSRRLSRSSLCWSTSCYGAANSRKSYFSPSLTTAHALNCSMSVTVTPCLESGVILLQRVSRAAPSNTSGCLTHNWSSSLVQAQSRDTKNLVVEYCSADIYLLSKPAFGMPNVCSAMLFKKIYKVPN